MKTVTYSCDRCGRTLDEKPKDRITIDGIETGLWETKDSDDNPKRHVDVDIVLMLTGTDEDRPDLCRMCLIDVLAEVQRILYRTHKLLRMAAHGLFLVQVNDGGWKDCVREDIDRADLPAKFDSREEAAQFIENVRGLMHMGGSDTEFRIVPSDPDAREIAEAPDEVQD